MKKWHTAIFTDRVEALGSDSPKATSEKERKKLARGKLADFLNKYKVVDFKVLRTGTDYIEIAYLYGGKKK